MKIQDFQEYFEMFILKYLPFKDKEIYNTIFNYLLDYYFTHSYEDIPFTFKQAYEDQVIPIEFYDKLLLSNGFPYDIVNKIQLSEKVILLNVFMDFNRYKGTLYSIQKVADSFNDLFNVYELYMDFRKIPRNDVLTVEENEPEWVFIPSLVYKNPQLTDELSTTFFTYDEIARRTKRFLISKEVAEYERLNNNILLPIKTNLILLDYKAITQHSIVLNLYFSTILNHFKDFTIILYLKDGQYKTTFKNFYKLWYYIFFKIYDVEFAEKIGNYVVFDFSSVTYPIRIEELPVIKKEYDAIITKSQLVAFQERYIDPFQEFTAAKNVSSFELLSNYQSELPVSLTTYIDNRIKNKDDVDPLLDELYSTLITWMYSLQTTYDEYKEFMQIFISQLPLLQVSLEKSTSYLLISHFKPYHVEIVTNDIYSGIRVNDKFNSVWMDNDILLRLMIKSRSMYHNFDVFYQNIKLFNTSNLDVIHFTELLPYYINLMLNDILHLFGANTDFSENTIDNIAHFLSLDIDLKDYTNMSILSEFINNVTFIRYMYNMFLNIFKFSMTIDLSSIENISHFQISKILDCAKYSELIILHTSKCLLSNIEFDDCVPIDKRNLLCKNIQASIENISNHIDYVMSNNMNDSYQRIETLDFLNTNLTSIMNTNSIDFLNYTIDLLSNTVMNISNQAAHNIHILDDDDLKISNGKVFQLIANNINKMTLLDIHRLKLNIDKVSVLTSAILFSPVVNIKTSKTTLNFEHTFNLCKL